MAKAAENKLVLEQSLATDDSCQFKFYAKGHWTWGEFNNAVDEYVRREGLDIPAWAIRQAPVRPLYQRTVRSRRDENAISDHEFHYSEEPSRGAAAVTLMDFWFPLHAFKPRPKETPSLVPPESLVRAPLDWKPVVRGDEIASTPFGDYRLTETDKGIVAAIYRGAGHEQLFNTAGGSREEARAACEVHYMETFRECLRLAPGMPEVVQRVQIRRVQVGSREFDTIIAHVAGLRLTCDLVADRQIRQAHALARSHEAHLDIDSHNKERAMAALGNLYVDS